MDLLEACVVESPSARWVAVDDAGGAADDEKPFSEVMGPALAWRRLSRDASRADAAAGYADADAPPAASDTVAAAARSRFAFFDSRRTGGALDGTWAFFENAGGSQVPRVVTEACRDALDARWRDDLGARPRGRRNATFLCAARE